MGLWIQILYHICKLNVTFSSGQINDVSTFRDWPHPLRVQKRWDLRLWKLDYQGDWATSNPLLYIKKRIYWIFRSGLKKMVECHHIHEDLMEQLLSNQSTEHLLQVLSVFFSFLFNFYVSVSHEENTKLPLIVIFFLFSIVVVQTIFIFRKCYGQKKLKNLSENGKTQKVFTVVLHFQKLMNFEGSDRKRHRTGREEERIVEALWKMSIPRSTVLFSPYEIEVVKINGRFYGYAIRWRRWVYLWANRCF